MNLVKSISEMYSPLFGRTIDPLTEILVSNGASGGFQAAIQSLVDPGDEVIIIEPFYDIYPAQVEMAGGKCVYVPLREPKGGSSNASDWKIDFEELENAITKKTKVLVIK